MKFVYKILLFSILSIGFPVGSLFDIFIWNDRIIKTEIVSDKQGLNSGGRTFFFIKSVKKHFNRLKKRLNVVIIEKITQTKNIRVLSVQRFDFYCFKASLIRRSLLKVLYVDDSEHGLMLSL